MGCLCSEVVGDSRVDRLDVFGDHYCLLDCPYPVGLYDIGLAVVLGIDGFVTQWHVGFIVSSK